MDVSLVDLVSERVSISELEKALKTSVNIPEPSVNEFGDPNKYTYRLVGKFEDADAMISVTPEGLMVKCTCGAEYPCLHVIALYDYFKKKHGKVVEKLKSLEDSSKEENNEEDDLVKKVAPQKKPKVFHDEPKTYTTDTSLKEKFYGKLTVIFGQPLTGKTTFAMMLAKQFKNPVIIKIDRNYRVEDYGINAKVYNVSKPREVLDAVLNTPAYEDTIVIVDSITSLDAYFMPEDPTKDDPRVANRRARFCDSVMLHLQKFKTHGAVVVIAHESIKDFRTGEVGPRMNAIALRHADMVLRITVENGKRKVKSVALRKVVENPVFEVEGL